MSLVAHKFGISNILVRIALSYGVLLAIYNPSGYSYLHWLVSWGNVESLMAVFSAVVLKLAAGLFLIMVCAALGSVIYNAMGRIAVLVVGLFSLSVTPIIYVVAGDLWGIQGTLLAGLGLFVSIGITYPGLRHRLSSQVQPANPQSGTGF